MGSITILYYDKTSAVWVKFVGSLRNLKSTPDFGAVAGDGNGVTRNEAVIRLTLAN